ncbi:MAG: helix-turn-helix transcriptional regulator [Methylobacter sp.]|jgi:prophage regulatory protein
MYLPESSPGGHWQIELFYQLALSCLEYLRFQIPHDRAVTYTVLLMVINSEKLQNTITHRLVRIKEAQQVVALSRSTIYSKLDKNSPHYDATFPRPITLGSRSIAFIESELQEWITSRINSSRRA